MLIFLRKHSLLISMLFLLTILISAWQLSSAMPILSANFIFFSIAISISSIMEKHKSLHQTQARRRIAKDITVLVISIIVAVILGGMVGQFAGSYAQAHWPDLDMAAGLLATMLTAFAVGFVIRRSVLKATHS